MDSFLGGLPLWSLLPIMLVLFLAALAAGFYAAIRWLRATKPSSDRGVGAITGASLGLLALLLAFVVGFGVNVWHERRDLVVSEANAIATTYLRAGYLDEPYRSSSRALLSEYTDQRVAALDKDKAAQAKVRSEEIHVELWALVNDLVRSGSTAATSALYVASLNEVIDLHTERVNMNLYVRIPPIVVLAVLLITLLALFLVGMQQGYTENRSRLAPELLVVVLAIVLYLIFDLDRAGEGLFQVPSFALVDLQTQLPTLP